MEHWGNAVTQAETAAHNMVCESVDRRPHKLPGLLVHPVRRQHQVGRRAVHRQGDRRHAGLAQEHRFVAVYGQGRIVAAVAFDDARWLAFYAALIEAGAPFPPA